MLEHVLGDRRSAPVVPLPDAARVGIQVARSGFKIEGLGFDFHVADLRMLAGRRVDNNETFHRRWERTITRVRHAHGTFGRRKSAEKAKTGDAINVTGFHPNRAYGAEQDVDQ